MSRNIKDWMIKEPVKGNHYKLWKLLPGSVFNISTSTGPVPHKVLKQNGALTQCFAEGKDKWMDSSIEVEYFSNIDNFEEAIRT
jgi:hypothetical protein